jgi:hypothetical protein
MTKADRLELDDVYEGLCLWIEDEPTDDFIELKMKALHLIYKYGSRFQF